MQRHKTPYSQFEYLLAVQVTDVLAGAGEQETSNWLGGRVGDGKEAPCVERCPHKGGARMRAQGHAF